jgi:hypothetical protein
LREALLFKTIEKEIGYFACNSGIIQILFGVAASFPGNCGSC